MKKLLTLLFMCLSLSSYAQTTTRFQAIKTDSSLSSMIERWGQENNAVIYWDNYIDFKIDDVEIFNEQVRLNQSTDLVDAVMRVTKFIKKERPNLIPLQTCVYTGGQELTLLVRPISLSCD